MVRIIFLSALFLLFSGLKPCFAEMGIVWDDLSVGLTGVSCVYAGGELSQGVYIATGNGIFKEGAAAGEWKNILYFIGGVKKINQMVSYGEKRAWLLAASDAGLYLNEGADKKWERIFTGKNSYEKQCTCVLAFSSKIYLGTKAGLFVSSDNGRSWEKQQQLGTRQIISIAGENKLQQCVYVSSSEALFKSCASGGNWEKVFIFHNSAQNADNPENDESSAIEDNPQISYGYVVIPDGRRGNIYVSTSAGIFASRDSGRNWHVLSDYGLIGNRVSFLLAAEQELYALTDSGIFKFEGSIWKELSLRLTGGRINYIALDSQGRLYAACENGIFRGLAGKIENSDKREGSLKSYLKEEPPIAQIHKAAIEYAEVNQEKIINWRRQASHKALLPQISLDLGRNVTDLWHWETGSSTKQDDDIIRKGNDSLEWSVGLSWDLSNLVWNDDQTSIDVRSRLMVELRQEILDEVTKLYFERIRLKMEMDSLSLGDRGKLTEKEIRLSQLTASLDALTNGYFSRQEARLKTVPSREEAQ